MRCTVPGMLLSVLVAGGVPAATAAAEGPEADPTGLALAAPPLPAAAPTEPVARLSAMQAATPMLLLPGLAASGSAQGACEGDGSGLLDELLGVWEEYQLSEEGRVLLGTLTTELAAGGCALVQSFESPDGAFSFRSLGHLDAQGGWQETYVLSTGRVSSYRWRKDGDTLVLDRTSREPGPKKRLVVFDVTEGGYYVAEEESSDGGRTWTRLDLVHTVRRGSARP